MQQVWEHTTKDIRMEEDDREVLSDYEIAGWGLCGVIICPNGKHNDSPVTFIRFYFKRRLQ